MKNSNNFFIVACFFQWISCAYYHYENRPLYRQFHEPFVNKQRAFYEPHIQEIKAAPLINVDLEHNYDINPIDFKSIFQDHTHSTINYSFETTPIKAPAYLYAMIAADHAKNKTDKSHDCSSDTVLKAPCLQKVPLKKADLQLAHEWRQSLHLHEQYESDSAHRFLNRIKAISDRTLSNKTVAIERLLLQESHDLTNIIETTTNPLIQKQSDSLRQCIKAAQEFVALKHPPIHGKNIYTALNNINQHIKKKYSIALDGLHKNHLELYDAKGNWKGVLNFDGTLNESFTNRGLSKSKRAIKKG